MGAFKGEGSVRVLSDRNTVRPARRLDLGFRVESPPEAETFSLRETETLQPHLSQEVPGARVVGMLGRTARLLSV